MNKENKAKYVLVAGFLVFFVGLFFISAPINFPTGITFTINKGQSLLEVAKNLEDAKIIRSKNLFQILVVSLASDKNVIEGDYLFSQKESVFSIAVRLTKGI